jgi:flagellar biogenesis protein FliO
MGTLADYFLQTALTLAALIALGTLAVLAARRLGPRVPNAALELVGHLPLGTRRAVYLVRVGSRVLILGASEAGFTALGEAPPGTLVDTPTRGSRSFSDVLRGLGSGRTASPAGETLPSAASSLPGAKQ